MDWLKTTPIVSLLLAMAFVAAPLAIDPAEGWGDRYDEAIEDARTLLIRNPRLPVDAEGERLLDPAWMAELRANAEETQAGLEVELPTRMVARLQAQLDADLAQAYEARRLAEPTWRLGVLDGDTPTRNYWAHAFIQDGWAGVGLLLVVLLFVGAPLERSWGSLLYAAFVMVAIPISAQGYRLLDASSGLPWSGSSGLAAALIGAYFIRSLGGQFMVPGLVVLPVWLGIEAFVVRGFWLDDLSTVPWATLCGAIGVGAGWSATLRLIGVESKLDAASAKRVKSGPNPVVVRAARLRSDGDPHQAFDLMQAAWREHRGDAEIAEVFYSVAVELGQPEAAAEAILPVLRGALKQGQIDRALSLWLPLATRRCEVRLEPTASVRLGEALLDAGHVDEALFSLSSALDAGASTAHAVRILNVARDLDPGLTRRAALIALNDRDLDESTRTRLAPLAKSAESDAVPAASPTPAARATEHAKPIGATPLERRIEAEHHAIEQTRFPDVPRGDAVVAPDAGSATVGRPTGSNGVGSAAAEPVGLETSPVESSDVLSHWNDRGAISQDALAESGGEEPGVASGSLFDDDVAERRSQLFGDEDLDFLDVEDASDADRTPLLDSTDELTSPMRAPAPSSGAGDADGEATVMLSTPGLQPVPSVPIGSSEFAAAAAPVGGSGAAAGPGPDAFLRSIRAIEAVPLELGSDAIEIDTDGRGKSRLPFARIEAVAVATVRGLGPLPVVVLDCILNWRDDIGAPLKLIRFRSDRFEASAIGIDAPGTDDVAAFGHWAASLARASGASRLPSDAILEGSVPGFASLEAYEREVLGAERELG
ncbi:MAG: rhomboid family intramembrane serine protease [Myxococcota bacterium]